MKLEACSNVKSTQSIQQLIFDVRFVMYCSFLLSYARQIIQYALGNPNLNLI